MANTIAPFLFWGCILKRGRTTLFWGDYMIMRSSICMNWELINTCPCIYSYVCFVLFFVKDVKPSYGAKPILIFSGEAFDESEEAQHLKSILIGKLFFTVSLTIV